MHRIRKSNYSPYITFDRDQWAKFRLNTPLTLSEADLEQLRGINVDMQLDEVVDIYLPLSRLLNLYVAARQSLHTATAAFLGDPAPKVPYVIAITGSVAVGKSTTARVLEALLSRWPNHPQVDLVTTDGFLYPNSILEERHMMNRKGYPESYDFSSLKRFVSAVKAGRAKVEAPVYSHLNYDILKGEHNIIDRPDILILEGLNVLGPAVSAPENREQVLLSDYFDFSIYVDADIRTIQQWYIERFLTFRTTAFRDPSAYFHRYASLSDEEARTTALQIWKTINEPNLRDHIEPTRERAQLVLEKENHHAVRRVQLRKI